MSFPSPRESAFGPDIDTLPPLLLLAPDPTPLSSCVFCSSYRRRRRHCQCTLDCGGGYGICQIAKGKISLPFSKNPSVFKTIFKDCFLGYTIVELLPFVRQTSGFLFRNFGKRRERRKGGEIRTNSPFPPLSAAPSGSVYLPPPPPPPPLSDAAMQLCPTSRSVGRQAEEKKKFSLLRCWE